MSGLDAGLAVDGADAALVTGTSWSDYLSIGGTADDIVTSGLARNTQYSYRVQAYNATADSAYSNTPTGKTRRR